MTRFASRVLRQFCNCVLLIVVQSSLVSATDFAIDLPPTSRYPQLVEKAQRDGTIRVMVSLKLSSHWVPDGHLLPAQLAQQQTNIRMAQQRLLALFPGKEMELTTTLFDVAGLAMRVTPEELTLLMRSDLVESVVEDGAGGGGLIESVPIVDAPDAWASGYTGAGQTIAIVDNGVNSGHTFLSGAVVEEICFSSIDAVSASSCPNGAVTQSGTGSATPCTVDIGNYTRCTHGTHVAGIAAGRSGSVGGTPIDGVAKGAWIIAVQIFHKIVSGLTVTGYQYYDADLVRGLEYVYSQRGTYKIAAVNMSLWFSGPSNRYSTACDNVSPNVTQAIARLRSVDIAPVIISGNEASQSAISYPGCISGAVVVGASTKGGAIWEDSTTDGSNSSSQVMLLAPGKDIRSSISGGTYNYLTGTSMAAPHVSGAFAILKQKHPTWGVAPLLRSLIRNGSPITDSRNGITTPRIDVAKSVNDDSDLAAIIMLLTDD